MLSDSVLQLRQLWEGTRRFATDSANRIRDLPKNFGVKPQISHGVALTPPVPASRLAAFANEPFETWASPSFSASLHQSQIAVFLPPAAYNARLKIDLDASGSKGRFGPEQRRKLMSHPRVFSTSECESGIIDRTACRDHSHSADTVGQCWRGRFCTAAFGIIRA